MIKAEKTVLGEFCQYSQTLQSVLNGSLANFEKTLLKTTFFTFYLRDRAMQNDLLLCIKMNLNRTCRIIILDNAVVSAKVRGLDAVNCINIVIDTAIVSDLN